MYPYQGIGAARRRVSDAMKQPGSELNQPRPVDPKLMPDPMKVGTLALPPIPVVPPGKPVAQPGKFDR